MRKKREYEEKGDEPRRGIKGNKRKKGGAKKRKKRE